MFLGLFVNSIGIFTGLAVPGLNNHLLNASSAESSRTLCPVLLSMRTEVTRPVFESTVASKIPLPVMPCAAHLFRYFGLGELIRRGLADGDGICAKTPIENANVVAIQTKRRIELTRHKRGTAGESELRFPLI